LNVSERLEKAGFDNYEIDESHGIAVLYLCAQDDMSILDRIKRGLIKVGVYDDDLDFMAEEILRSLGECG
jgi:hypothetical protein